MSPPMMSPVTAPSSVSWLWSAPLTSTRSDVSAAMPTVTVVPSTPVTIPLLRELIKFCISVGSTCGCTARSTETPPDCTGPSGCSTGLVAIAGSGLAVISDLSAATRSLSSRSAVTNLLRVLCFSVSSRSSLLRERSICARATLALMSASSAARSSVARSDSAC